MTNQLGNNALMNVYTVAENKAAVMAKNGLSVNPDYAMKDAPERFLGNHYNRKRVLPNGAKG